jgi:hypothetical protein
MTDQDLRRQAEKRIQKRQEKLLEFVPHLASYVAVNLFC